MRYTVQEGETSYTDTSVIKRQVYRYTIYAVDMAGNCSEQYQMEAVTDPLPEAAEEFTLASENQRNYISFIKSGLRECGYYEIYRRPDYISQYTKIATIVNDKNEEESYEDVDVFSGGKYYYYIVSYSADGTTGAKGIISFPVEEGTYQIAAYKDGYKPKDMTVTVEKGNKKEVMIELEQNSLISASITSKKMTHEEMEKEGIDTDKNRAVYDYTLALKYEKEEIPTLKFDNRNESKNRWTFEVPIYNESGDGMHESKEKKKIDITDVSDDPENPVFVVTQTEKISISWLSNVYKVTMMLCSEAGETFGLKNVKVKLSLPKELQLAQILYLV